MARHTSGSGTYTITMEIECPYPASFEVKVTGTVTPFVPGRTSGLPENYYPDEGGEVNIEEVTREGKPFELSKSELAQAEDLLVEEAESDGGYDGPDPDDGPDY